MVYDPVKAIREQWRSCRPDLDTRPMDIAGHLLLAASLLQARVDPVLKQHGLSSGSFDVLATLRRQGPPFELTPTTLYKELLITSGTMTHRLDGLQASGLIKRSSHPSDRRGLLVRLTKKGLALIDRVIEAHLDNERQLFKSISNQDADHLSRILAKWIAGLEEKA